MSMEIDRKELKRRARQAMAQASPSFWVVALVFFLLTTGVDYALSLLASMLGRGESRLTATLFLTVLVTFYTLVIQFGLRLWSLWTVRGLNPGLDALTQGFSVFGRVLIMELGIWSRTILWSATFGILLLSPVVFLPGLFDILLLPCIGLLYVAVWAIMLRYSMSAYLLADRPDDGANAAIHRSNVLMKGWKWELFKLEFSFVGWHILQYVLVGVALGAVLLATGFVSALREVGFQAIPDILAGYRLWSAGVSPDVMGLSEEVQQLILRYAQVRSDTGVAFLTEVVTLPVFLWLTPYLHVARAAFYDARLRLHMESVKQP